MSTITTNTFFRENGSGAFEVQLITEAENCQAASDSNVNSGRFEFEALGSSAEGTSGNCTYTFEFNNLEGIREQYETLGIGSNELVIQNERLIYRVSDQICDLLNEDVTLLNWSVETPSRIVGTSRHPGETIGENQVSWKLTAQNCNSISVRSKLSESTPEPTPSSTPPPLPTTTIEPKLPQPSFFDLLDGWAGVGASIATIIGTIVAIVVAISEFKKRR